MSVQGIDFSRLSLLDALDLAILIEAEAQERYEEFAHQMTIHDSPGPAKFHTVRMPSGHRLGSSTSPTNSTEPAGDQAERLAKVTGLDLSPTLARLG